MGGVKEILQMAKNDFNSLVASLIAAKPNVIGVKAKGNRYAYDKLEQADELVMDYDETILRPKKYFVPAEEVLLKFKTRDASSYQEIYDDEEMVIIGEHPADLAAIALTDKAFSEEHRDNHYFARRDNTALIGIYPTVAYQYRFTNSMISDEAYRAADLMLIDMGNGSYAIEVVTDKGKNLLAGAKTSALSDTAGIEARKKAVVDELTLDKPYDSLPAFLAGRENDPVFTQRAEKCFSCGSCVLVCPTCYCFNVKDEVELSLEKGQRVRTWDGCMIQSFAEVAGGHNFRDKAANRLRHRIFRKGKYIQEKFGLAGCVGCGRCGQACVADIASPVEILNEMK